MSVDTVAHETSQETRPMYWSIRRELWENRSIYIAPLIVTAIVLFASLLGTIGLPRRMRNAEALDPVQRHVAIVKPFSMAPAPIMLATFLVGLFYSLDALYGERRDRSILFWKSLPVSDLTTVLSKVAIPLAVLPFIGFILGWATQMFLVFFSTFVLLGSGINPARLWTELQLVQSPMVMVYGMAVHALWFLPIYGYLLLVSAWARRMPFLWAIFPPFLIGVAERMMFGTTHFGSLMRYRFMGAMVEAFTPDPKSGRLIDGLAELSPGRFLVAPGLWLGLFFGAACLAAAVRLRRNREPI